MVHSSEHLAEKADKTQNFTFLAKSNSLRRASKEKSDEASALETEIDKKLLDIKGKAQ